MQALPQTEQPAALSSRPVLWDENQEALKTFNFLSPRRQQGFSSIQPINLNEIVGYWTIYGTEDIADLSDKICAADEAFIVHLKQKETQE